MERSRFSCLCSHTEPMLRSSLVRPAEGDFERPASFRSVWQWSASCSATRSPATQATGRQTASSWRPAAWSPSRSGITTPARHGVPPYGHVSNDLRRVPPLAKRIGQGPAVLTVTRVMALASMISGGNRKKDLGALESRQLRSLADVRGIRKGEATSRPRMFRPSQILFVA